MSTLLHRLRPNSLFARMMLLILLALVLAQFISFWFFSSAHRDALRHNSQRFSLRQFVSRVQLLENIPETRHRIALRAWKTPGRRVGLYTQPPIPAGKSYKETEFERWLEEKLGTHYQGRVRVTFSRDIARDDPPLGSHKMPHGKEHEPGWRQPPAYRKTLFARGHFSYLSLAVKLTNGQWFVSRMRTPSVTPLATPQVLVFIVTASLLILGVVFWQLRHITRPLRALAKAANALGRGQAVAPLNEEGPEDIQLALRAFNQMNKRLQRFVSERTRTLAALSHDLRTPLTSMRLRVEMMEENPDRDKLLQSLNEMQQMSEAALAFVRQSGDLEATSVIDMGALVGSICDDLAELDKPVKFTEPPYRLVLDARPVALTRAIRNLVENAVNYGNEAQVELQDQGDAVSLLVRDQGPGIPQDRMISVFEPFFRLDSSRNRETGGIGLGLSIARQIIINHGGKIQLNNCHPGLEVRVDLPKSNR